MSTAITRSGRAVLATLLVLLAVFGATHIASMPGTVSYFREVTSGQELLDLRASSSADETWSRLDAMGPAGRAAYARLIVVVDLVFPLAVFAFLLTLARFVAARTSRAIAWMLVSIPVVYLALDLAENALVWRLLSAFPARLDFEGALVGLLTRGKRVAQVVALAAPLVVWAIVSTRTRLGRESSAAKS